MTSAQVGEMLDHAADSVTPTETDPATRLVTLGRQSVRRRRAWAAAGFVAAAAAAVVAVPLALTAPDVATPATTITYAGLSVDVPKGWRISRVPILGACLAEPQTVYLAQNWDVLLSKPTSADAPALHCRGGQWMAIVGNGTPPSIDPNRLVVKDGRLLEVEQGAPEFLPSMLMYHVAGELRAPMALISGDKQDQAQLLRRIAWPPGPPAPRSGGLALPDHLTSATADRPPPTNGMVVAADAKTLSQIQAKLSALRDPVAAGKECALQKPGSIGIDLENSITGESVIVVLGGASCPQAISTGGGRVRAPAGLGQELLNLIIASDDAATKHPRQK